MKITPFEPDKQEAPRKAREQSKAKAKSNGHDDTFTAPFDDRGRGDPLCDRQILPPAPNRDDLLLAAWVRKVIPPRDKLLGDIMCTTSRWLLIGETGVGKTLFSMDMGAAVAAEKTFLKWGGHRKARVIFLDGELPIETFKGRMELIAKRYGPDLQFYGYNREDLGFDGMPPLNTDLGQTWLRREIEAIKPDLIIFDSIMCLLIGSMTDEATWMPMRPFIRELSARRIAQVWNLHANDLGRGFGDKTREWEMDTVAALVKAESDDDDDSTIRFEFRKARLRTPANAGEFLPLVIRPGDNWRFEVAKTASDGKCENDVEVVKAELLRAYDRLADGATKTLGLDGNSTVLKVFVAKVREELKDRGFLDTAENGAIERVSRNHFSRAKRDLLRRGTLIEKKGQIWRP